MCREDLYYHLKVIDIRLPPPSAVIPSGGMDLAQRLHELEKTYFATAIRQTDGNREAAAKLLGIQPHTFRKRAKEKFGL